MPAEEYRTITTYLWILGIATYQYINFKILVILINITKINTLHMSLISQEFGALQHQVSIYPSLTFRTNLPAHAFRDIGTLAMQVTYR